MTPPGWYAKLPTFHGKKLLAVDTNTLGAYFFETPTPDVIFAFETPGLQIQCSRKVIDEALNHPDFHVSKRQEMWKQLAQMQETGKIFLSGTSQMAPQQLGTYGALIGLLSKAMVQTKDAPVAADAIVKRVPLLTIDFKFRNALKGALNNAAVRAFLRQNSLANSEAAIFAN